MNTLAMMMSVIGLVISWIPGWGWLGVALCLGAVVVGIRGLTNKKTHPGAMGMDVAANIVGGFGVCWGIAFQIKHAAGELDSILAPFDITIACLVTVIAAVVLFSGQILGRKSNRTVGITIALIALLCLGWSGTTLLTLADRAMLEDTVHAEMQTP